MYICTRKKRTLSFFYAQKAGVSPILALQSPYFGPDWIWQRVDGKSKHAVRVWAGTIISALENLIGENNYALAA